MEEINQIVTKNYLKQQKITYYKLPAECKSPLTHNRFCSGWPYREHSSGAKQRKVASEAGVVGWWRFAFKVIKILSQ